MYLQVDTSSGIPIFIQIVNQMKYSVAMGAYRPDDKLPSVRELAVKLRLNPNTIARAYRELDREGVVYKQRGRGVFVSADAAVICRQERKRIIDERLNAAIDEALRSDLDPADIRSIVESKLNEKGQRIP